NASEAADLPYYANKGRIERLIAESAVDYTILRPALVVGDGDILVNNIAYFLRRLPAFTIFGDGAYPAPPVTVAAFADIALAAISGGHGNTTCAVAGPSDWTFVDMVRAIRAAVRSRALIVTAPAWVALAGLKVAGALLGDVVLTADEIRGLTREYLRSADPLRRGIDFADWLAPPAVAAAPGTPYDSGVARHFRVGYFPAAAIAFRARSAPAPAPSASA